MIQTPQPILPDYAGLRLPAGRAIRRAMGRQRGFNFTEVLFAVMILGIGFVMVAAMFPVTIRQTALTMEEAAGANMAKDAIQALQAIATDQAFPPTSTGPGAPGRIAAVTQSTVTDAWRFCCRSNFVSSQNPRYGWVAMYRRDLDEDGNPSAFAQVIVIATQCRNRQQYFISDVPGAVSDVLPTPSGDPPTLMPRLVKVTVTSTGGVSAVKFNGSGQALAAPGAYLVIAGDATNPKSNGRIYQFGNLNETTGQYELIPGGDQIRSAPALTSDDPDHNNVDAFVLGRGYTDPANNQYSYSGPAQDVGVYVSFIRVAPTVPGP